MLDQKTAVALATTLGEGSSECAGSGLWRTEISTSMPASTTIWTVKPKPAMDLNVVTEIAQSYGLVAWMAFTGEGVHLGRADQARRRARRGRRDQP